MKRLLDLFRKPAPKVRERSTRIRLLLSDGARLETADGAYPLLNLSESGIGMLCEAGQMPQRVAGRLFLGSEILAVELEIVRRDGSHAGARFLGDGAAVRSALRRLFTEEIRATEMSEVDSNFLAGEGEGRPRWFYAPGNYELFFLEGEGGVLRVEIEWNGKVISARPGEPCKVGRIEAEERHKPGHAKSALVSWEGEAEDADRAKAVRIIENISGLEPETRGKIVSLLRKAPVSGQSAKSSD
jgi:hypothetical protein